MLEMLLIQYEEQLGEEFPLKDFADKTELQLLNVLYYCVQYGKKYSAGMEVPDLITEAPGAH